MPQATLQISSTNVVNAAGGLSIANLYIVANTPIFSATTLNFAGSGFQSVTVPSGATWVVIVPPSTNTQTLTLKGITGDTGVALSPSQPSVLALAGTGNIGITAGGAAGAVVVSFT